MPQKIIPHLWFDKEAVQAAEFYTSVFEEGKITHKSVIKDTPSGDCDLVEFSIAGYQIMAIAAGPIFKINPSVSFHVRCSTIEEVDSFYKKLSEEGKVLMELAEYPFSKRYAWVEDKFGVSWQVIHTEKEFSQKIVPAFLFTQELCGNAKKAIEYYSQVFPKSSTKTLGEYGKNAFNEKETNIMYGEFSLVGYDFIAMDSSGPHQFKLNEAVSFVVICKDQEEIDYFWGKLSAHKENEQCGWVKDQFGVSWQIIPQDMDKLMGKNPQKTVPAMLAMKKINIAELEKAGNA